MPSIPQQQVAIGDDDARYHQPIDAWSRSNAVIRAGAGGAGLNQGYGSTMRFASVPIPVQATIVSASITITGWSTPGTGVGCKTKLRAEDVDNSPTYTSKADWKSRFPANATTAVTLWDSIGNWVADTEFTSPDISAVIQEVIDRAGWSFNNAISIIWDDWDQRSDAVATALRTGWSYDGSAAKACKLDVTYTGGVTPQVMLFS